MALLVQKFGGSSLESLECIERVADNIVASRREGHDLVVVVSAMGGSTDHLIEKAKHLQQQPEPREYSMLVSSGEQVSMSLLAMALRARGCQAASFTGGQAGIKTSSDFKKARIQTIECQRIQEQVRKGIIPVIAGFQGHNQDGDITTLGRGGSDTTAVALAAALEADECQIYTDVDGVYTTDPRVEPKARRLAQITFEEMLEMSSLGAKVLQIRAVEFAGKYNVPLRVLSTFNPGPGTLISLKGTDMENAVISGIAFNRSEAKITIRGVPDIPGVAFRILGPISDADIEVDMIIQNIASDNTTDFTFTVHRDDYDRAIELLSLVCEKLNAREVIGNKQIAKVSLVGVGMRSHSGIASQMFETLGSEGINMQMISTSEIKISVIMDEKYLELGVRALHECFSLAEEADEEFDPRV